MMRRRGFTLLEVVIAVSITAFIGVVLGVTFNSTINNKEIIEGQAEHYRMLSVAMSRMVREIGAAYVSDRFDSKRYRDAYDRPTNFIGSRDRLLFTSLAHQRLYRDAKESDQMVVEYKLNTSMRRGAKGQKDLIRRERARLEERMEVGGTEDVLFEGVKKLRFQYWNSARKQWDSEWDTRRSTQKSQLPTRVKITLFTGDDSGKEVQYTTQTRIMLNSEFERYR